MEEKNKAYATFEERDRIASLGGGTAKIEKQHESGKMTARERIDMLLDKGTFVELDKLMVHRCTNYGMDKNKIPGDGIVSGYGKIDGRQVFVYAYDFTVYGGSLSASNAKKNCKSPTTCLEERRSDYRPERFRRRTHPGRHREPFRLCGHLLSEHNGERCDSADFSYSRPLCRRRLLLSCSYRLYIYGKRTKPYVRDWSRCCENRHS